MSKVVISIFARSIVNELLHTKVKEIKIEIGQKIILNYKLILIFIGFQDNMYDVKAKVN